jgi:hypothetical protein
MTAVSSDLPPREEHPAAVPAVSPSGGLIGLVVVAGAIDVLVCPLIRACARDGAVALIIVPLAFGIICGQVGALALWLVWGEGPFLRRLLIHWIAAASLAIALSLGLALTIADQSSPFGRGDVLRSLEVVFCLLPAISLLGQLPHWPLRIYCGWRVERPASLPTASSQPLTILDMLSGTAVVGITLGLLRVLAGFNSGGGIPASFVWMEAAMPAVIALGVSLLIGFPALLCLLGTSDATTGVLWFGGYLVLGVLSIVGIPSFVSGGLSIEPLAAVLLVLLLGTFVLGATVAAPLLVLRLCGYRLTRPRDRRSLT